MEDYYYMYVNGNKGKMDEIVCYSVPRVCVCECVCVERQTDRQTQRKEGRKRKNIYKKR